MNPKEKAQELMDKFSDYATPTFDEENKFSTYNSSKKCALIAVKEILNCNPHTNPFNTDVYSTYDYWFQVKLEIEKL